MVRAGGMIPMVAVWSAGLVHHMSMKKTAFLTLQTTGTARQRRRPASHFGSFLFAFVPTASAWSSHNAITTTSASRISTACFLSSWEKHDTNSRRCISTHHPPHYYYDSTTTCPTFKKKRLISTTTCLNSVKAPPPQDSNEYHDPANDNTNQDPTVVGVCEWEAGGGGGGGPINNNDASQSAFSFLASRGKSWKRLGPLVQLACSYSHPTTIQKSIADVGCDHGLLALGLGVSGHFKQVVGVDASEQALQNGAIYQHQKMWTTMERRRNNNNSTITTTSTATRNPSSLDVVSSMEFRVGNGLEPLHPGEADIVCIAGMGVDTMMDILFSKIRTVSHSSRQQNDPGASSSQSQHAKDNESETRYRLDMLATECLILQPSSSRPRHLVEMYDLLQSMGWSVHAEHMEQVSSRFYLSVGFSKPRSTSSSTNMGVEVNHMDHKKNGTIQYYTLPGQKLASLPPTTHETMLQTYRAYVKHHRKWLASDLQKKGSHLKEDIRWLTANQRI
eukprot:scaffold92903_cov58-Attheya_sp.AAC.1